MRLATLRTPDGTRAVRVDGDSYVDLGVPDVGALLADPSWAGAAGPTVRGTRRPARTSPQ
jgi:acylpyruvate hydrolase